MPDFPQPEALLRMLSTQGMKDAEIYFTGASTLSVEYAGNTYKSKEFSEDAGYGVRIIKKGKVGFSHTNILGNFQKAAKTADHLSKISPKTNFEFIPKPKKYPRMGGCEKKISGLPPEIAFTAVEEILEAIKKRAEPTRVSVSISEGTESIANSEGMSTESSCTAVSIYAEAKKGKGMGYALYSSRFLPKSFRKFGAEAGKIAAIMVDSRPIPSQKLTVKFSPHMLSSLLSFLMFNFDGDNKRRGITRLKKGQKKFDSSFTLISDPLADADSSCPFDGEGAPSAPLPLIEKGVVRNFLYDKYTAALEGITDGGSCQRTDYASTPSPGITNLVIAPGKFKGKEDKYLEVISFHGLHTADPVSGNFGVNVDIAVLHENGKKTPVSDILLTGNIFNLFNSIKHFGNVQHVDGSLVSPEVWFENVQIVGK
jgi:PmbA protein